MGVCWIRFIGFYSVFMLGDKVSVTTRRYDEDRNNTRVLEFKNGTDSRPLLRNAEKRECLKEGGTKIRVYLKDQSKWANILKDKERPFDLHIANLFSSMDCNIRLKINNDPPKSIIKANDWISMDPFLFLKRTQTTERQLYNHSRDNKKYDEYIKKLSARVRLVKNKEGLILGRGALDANIGGLLATGGIRAGETRLFAGALLAKCDVANRYEASPCISEEELKPWVEEQVKILSKDLSWEKEDPGFDTASLIYSFNICTENLSVAYYNDKPVNYDEIKQIIKINECDKYVVFHYTSIYMIEEKNIQYNKNVFRSKCGIPFISSNSHLGFWGDIDYLHIFPNSSPKMVLANIIAKACAEVWHEDVNLITKFSTSGQEIYETIGTSDGKEIQEECYAVITRPTKNSTN